MTELFLDLLALCGIMMTLLGLWVFLWVFIKPKKEPMDSSNRIGHLRLVWFALSKPHDFVYLYAVQKDDTLRQKFHWLTEDEEDIVG